MTESPIAMEENALHLTSNLKNIRLVGSHLVVEPIAPQDCAIKTGHIKYLVVHADDGSSAQVECIQADGDESNSYQIDKRIKEAICGDVHTGFQLQTVDNNEYKRKDLVVIKIISLQKIENLKNQGKLQEDPIKEISILQMFDENSRHVCNQIECIRDDKYIYSIMRHYGDELFNYAGKLTEDQSRDYFIQIVEGVKTLQRFDVCHRDLSLENILLSSDGVCTIIDFGMSLIYPTAEASALHTVFQSLSNSLLVHSKDLLRAGRQVIFMPPQGTCGKVNYIAPEILTNLDPFNGALVDNWALGVILFMLVTGRPPFYRASKLDKWFRMIQQGELREMLRMWKIDHLSDNVVDLLQKLLKGSSIVSRMSTDDILLHPWLQSSPCCADEQQCSGV